jgi:hypothetical protein
LKFRYFSSAVGLFDLVFLKWISSGHQKRNHQSRKPSFPGLWLASLPRFHDAKPCHFLADGGVSADHSTTSDP